MTKYKLTFLLVIILSITLTACQGKSSNSVLEKETNTVPAKPNVISVEARLPKAENVKGIPNFTIIPDENDSELQNKLSEFVYGVIGNDLNSKQYMNNVSHTVLENERKRFGLEFDENNVPVDLLLRPFGYPSQIHTPISEQYKYLTFEKTGSKAKLVLIEERYGKVNLYCFPFSYENNSWKASFTNIRTIPEARASDINSSSSVVSTFCPQNLIPYIDSVVEDCGKEGICNAHQFEKTEFTLDKTTPVYKIPVKRAAQ